MEAIPIKNNIYIKIVITFSLQWNKETWREIRCIINALKKTTYLRKTQSTTK